MKTQTIETKVVAYVFQCGPVDRAQVAKFMKRTTRRVVGLVEVSTVLDSLERQGQVRENYLGTWEAVPPRS